MLRRLTPLKTKHLLQGNALSKVMLLVIESHFLLCETFAHGTADLRWKRQCSTACHWARFRKGQLWIQALVDLWGKLLLSSACMQLGILTAKIKMKSSGPEKLSQMMTLRFHAPKCTYYIMFEHYLCMLYRDASTHVAALPESPDPAPQLLSAGFPCQYENCKEATYNQWSHNSCEGQTNVYAYKHPWKLAKTFDLQTY